MSKSQKKSQTLKREHPALQNMKFLIFFYFCGSFCPPGSGFGFWIRIRIHWPDIIRIQFGSGSATLKNTKILWSGSWSCRHWIWDPGWKKWDSESWIRDVYPGSGILDLGMGCLSRIRDPGSGMFIPDPQHWF